MKRLIFVLLPFMPLPLSAELIPADRLTPWTPGLYTGVWGGIAASNATRTVFTNCSGLDMTGVTDQTAEFQSILDACPEGQIVSVPAGTLKLLANYTFVKGGITIRGASKYGTTLLASMRKDHDNSTHLIHTYQLVTNGLSKGSTNIGVADVTDFTVGKLCMIAQYSSTNQNDPNLIVGVGGLENQYGYLYKPVFRVIAKQAGQITIWPPLFGDMTNRYTRIMPFAFTSGGLGVESLQIVGTGSQFALSLTGFRDSWITNVCVTNVNNYGMSIVESVGIEVRDCDLMDNATHGSPASNGAGLLMNTTCASLVENNILLNVFPSAEINAASCGNVFGYNFLLMTNELFDLNMNHGPHNAFNLYEGNVTARAVSDGYFGSASEITMYRNWVHAQPALGGTAMGYAVALKRFNRRWNLVGNIIGSATPFTSSYDLLSFGQPHIGNGDDNGNDAPPWPDWGWTNKVPSDAVYDGSGNYTVSVLGKDTPYTWTKGANDATLDPGAGATLSETGVFTAEGATAAMTGTAGVAVTATITVPTGSAAFNEFDTNVFASALISDCYIHYHGAVTNVSGESLPNSLYLSQRPSWYGLVSNVVWPPFTPSSPGVRTNIYSLASAAIPAHWRWATGTNPPTSSGSLTTILRVNTTRTTTTRVGP